MAKRKTKIFKETWAFGLRKRPPNIAVVPYRGGAIVAFSNNDPKSTRFEILTKVECKKLAGAMLAAAGIIRVIPSEIKRTRK